jgi:hypothetical protein
MVVIVGCGRERTTTFLLGSEANADAQNASESTTLAHRTDQPPKRLGLPTVFTS